MVKGLLMLSGCMIVSVWQLTELSLERQWLATVVLLAYALVLGWSLRRYRQRQPGTSGPVDFLIAYASETGTARQLAQQTRKRLLKQGFSSAITELNRLGDAVLPGRALLVVASTTGQGDPPRSGDRWPQSQEIRRYHDMPYAVLALGDRSYPQFCAFGLSIAGQLQQAGAKPLFAPVQISQADTAMIRYWFQCLDLAVSEKGAATPSE